MHARQQDALWWVTNVQRAIDIEPLMVMSNGRVGLNRHVGQAKTLLGQ
jgi:hypothetical protein